MSESSTTPTPETPSLAEMKRLREAANPVEYANGCLTVQDSGINYQHHLRRDSGLNPATGEYLAYAANFAVQIAESLERENAELVAQLADERKHSDELLKCLHLMRCTIGEAYEHWDADRDSKTGKLLMSLGGGLPGYRADIDAIHETIKESAERRKA